MYEYFLYAYVTAIGFCAAGLSASLSQLLTGRPMAFGLGQAAPQPTIVGVLARVVAGPAIVMRNAIKAVLMGRPPYWLMLSTLISVVWSFCSGVVLLELIFSLTG